jgi:hypothetical protein
MPELRPRRMINGWGKGHSLPLPSPCNTLQGLLEDRPLPGPAAPTGSPAEVAAVRRVTGAPAGEGGAGPARPHPPAHRCRRGRVVADPTTIPTSRADCLPSKAFPVRKAHGVMGLGWNPRDRRARERGCFPVKTFKESFHRKATHPFLTALTTTASLPQTTSGPVSSSVTRPGEGSRSFPDRPR